MILFIKILTNSFFQHIYIFPIYFFLHVHIKADYFQIKMNGIDVFCVAISVCEQYTAQMTRGMLYMAVTVIPALHARSDSFSQTVSHLSLAY